MVVNYQIESTHLSDFKDYGLRIVTTTASITEITTSVGEGENIYDTRTDIQYHNTGTDVAPNWVNISGAGGLSNIVEDTTPQLGGDLDCNTKKITGVTEIQTTTSILFKKV